MTESPIRSYKETRNGYMHIPWTYSMGSVNVIFKDRGINLSTTKMIVQILAFPIILYRAETWAI